MSSPEFSSIDEVGHVKSVHNPWTEGSCYLHVNLCGSCNGLLLLALDDDFFLWNPVTNYLKKVLSFFRPLFNRFYDYVAGLCYDSSTDEYKVVTALSAKYRVSEAGEFVVVGNLRSRTWTSIRFPYEVGTVNNGPTVNGYLHWFAHTQKSGEHFIPSGDQIICFDPRINKFKKVPMPEAKHGGEDVMLGLGAIDGCLCMSRWEDPSNGRSDIEVLAMKEYGMGKSWTCMLVISKSRICRDSGLDDLVIFLYPLGCTKDGEALIIRVTFNSGPCAVVVYDPYDIEPIDFTYEPDYCFGGAVTYEQSFVMPKGYGYEDEENLRDEPIIYTEFELYEYSQNRNFRTVDY